MTRSGHDARRPPEATIPAGGSAPARQSRASDIEARAAARLIALTANPHPLLSKVSALHHGPASTAYLISLRGLPATLERLHTAIGGVPPAEYEAAYYAQTQPPSEVGPNN
jgi:hypothetical protein